MELITGFAIYFIIWWLVLFITLPFRMKSQLETGEVIEGTDPAAPANPQLARRLTWNTIISLGVFGLYWFVVYYLGFGLDAFPDIVPDFDARHNS